MTANEPVQWTFPAVSHTATLATFQRGAYWPLPPRASSFPCTSLPSLFIVLLSFLQFNFSFSTQQNFLAKIGTTPYYIPLREEYKIPTSFHPYSFRNFTLKLYFGAKQLKNVFTPWVSNPVSVLYSPHHVMCFCSVEQWPLWCQMAPHFQLVPYRNFSSSHWVEPSLSLACLHSLLVSSHRSGYSFSDFLLVPPALFQENVSYSMPYSIP